MNKIVKKIDGYKKTKIIATIGPKSENKEVMRELILNGVNVIRMNFSHGDYAEHGARLETARELEAEIGKTVGILLDTKGPEIRTGEFAEDTMLDAGQNVVITMEDVIGTKEKFTVTYKELAKDVKVGERVMLDDGLISLLVTEINNGDLTCLVENTGMIKTKKGVNVPGADLKFDFMSEKDKADIIFGCQNNVDIIAASFVRNAADVNEVREIMNANGGENIILMSKVECVQALDNLEEIIEASDSIMVARGDLGIEIPAEDVPVAQKRIIKMCNAMGKPVVTATQMLETMQKNPRPTRAEASDVANAIWDGTDCVMLSGETAAGDYPVEAVKTMAAIAYKTEENINYEKKYLEAQLRTLQGDHEFDKVVSKAISSSASIIASTLDAKAIVTGTVSGSTAKLISKDRPQCPIIAVTPNRDVAGKLTIYNGVYTVEGLELENSIETAIEKTRQKMHVETGDVLVLVGGAPAGEGKTNFIHVHTEK